MFTEKVTTNVRYVLAIGVLIFTIYGVYNMRAWTYGFNPVVYALFILLPFSAIILLWPQIVWKKNWLLGLIPAAFAVLVCLFVSVMGTQSSFVIDTTIASESLRSESIPLPETQKPSKLPGILMSLSVGSVALVLLLAMQQRKQQIVVLLCLISCVIAFESIYQNEERQFRKERDQIRTYIATTFQKTGVYPTNDVFKTNDSDIRGSVSLGEDGNFSMWWDRPLNQGYAIHYSSVTDEVSIQD